MRRKDMNKRYQIFISSTYDDLKEVRSRATEEILKLGHIPIGMEMFNPDDDEQWSQIQQGIDDSDYYVIIVAQRYGSITKGGIGYTQKEYNYAVKKKIPILRFIISDEAEIKRKFIENDSDKLYKLNQFKEILKKRPVSFWNNVDDFASKLVQGLIYMFNKKPRIGWIKGDSFLNPEILNRTGLKDYESKCLKFIKETIEDEIYYEYFERKVELELLNDGLEIIISNEFVIRNILNYSEIYCPQPCFESIEQAKSYKHVEFQLNGKNSLSSIKSRIDERSRNRQFPYVVMNDIDYSEYVNENGIHIYHKYKYIRSDFKFYMGYQITKPCKEFRVDAHINNDINNKYKFLCFAASQYKNKRENKWKSEIYTDEHSCQINFAEWAMPGSGYSLNLAER